jgi:glycosyltransferase involved in cell wall biosynthesis
MRILVCHSVAERCGIHQYGHALDVSLRKLPVEVLSFDYSNLNALTGVVGQRDVVLFHFEPGVIGNQAVFQSALRTVRARGGKVVFCCHMYEDGIGRTYGSMVDRFVLHRTYYGAPPKSAVIPLGCPVYSPAGRDELRQQWGFPSGVFVLTTVGFLTSWKRTPEVVAAVVDAISPSGMLVYVQAPWPADSAGALAQREDASMRRTVQGREAQVRFSTDFLPEARLLDLIHASDLGFVFHGIDTGSVSAATKAFISGRCPVVITGSSHSADMIRGVKRVSGFDPRIFGQEVVKIASDAGLLEKLRAGVEAEYQRLNMDAVAKLYVEEFGRL